MPTPWPRLLMARERLATVAPGTSMVVKTLSSTTNPWPLTPISLLPSQSGCRCSAPPGSRESAAIEVALKKVRANAHTTIALPSFGRRPRTIRGTVFPASFLRLIVFLCLANRESLISPYDPAAIVDIKGGDELDQRARGIDRGERPMAQQECIGSRVIGIRTNNLAVIVDAEG
jgi:hypothetical protein